MLKMIRTNKCDFDVNNMNINGYLDYINAPWGRSFYRLVWHNLKFSNKKILDFGSGFGVTSNYLAKFNDVTAVELNSGFLKYRMQKSGRFINSKE